MLEIFHYCIANQDKSLFIFFCKSFKIVLFQPENYDAKYDELLTRYDLSRLLQREGGASVVMATVRHILFWRNHDVTLITCFCVKDYTMLQYKASAFIMSTFHGRSAARLATQWYNIFLSFSFFFLIVHHISDK